MIGSDQIKNDKFRDRLNETKDYSDNDSAYKYAFEVANTFLNRCKVCHSVGRLEPVDIFQTVVITMRASCTECFQMTNVYEIDVGKVRMVSPNGPDPMLIASWMLLDRVIDSWNQENAVELRVLQ